MKVYKITDKDNYTQRGEEGEMLWGKNVTHVAKGSGGLRNDGGIHCYRDPYLAVFMSPIYENYNPMKLWEAETPIIIYDDGTISDVSELTTIKEIPLPKFTAEQRIKIAISCALEVYKDTKFQDWAMKWLSGKDRSVASTRDAVSRTVGAVGTDDIIAWDATFAAHTMELLSYGWEEYADIIARHAACAASSSGAKAAGIDIINIIWAEKYMLSRNIIELMDAIVHFLENAPYNLRAAPLGEMVRQVAENTNHHENIVLSAITDLEVEGKITISGVQGSTAKVVKLV